MLKSNRAKIIRLLYKITMLILGHYTNRHYLVISKARCITSSIVKHCPTKPRVISSIPRYDGSKESTPCLFAIGIDI